MRILWLTALITVLASAARAEVVDAQASGFEVRETAHIAAPPAQVYETLVHVERWWDGHHSFSGDAANLSLDPQVGGCFCETLSGGGGVAHLRVIYVQPGQTLRLQGALGPLQALGATGVLTFSLKPEADGTLLVLTYDAGGYARGGFASWAGPVDAVLGQQRDRLKRLVETGKP